ncbi:carbon-nitrogen hydrolase family protein [Ningiella sp. W23]|uniref:carbon-nitrogen hydrolase family protein n=1 Tax=Ningiella sp. W23 TaxID=3023715 RepID=UPI003756D0CD
MVDLFALQINGSGSVDNNLAKIESILTRVRVDVSKPALIILPECASCFGVDGATMRNIAELDGSGAIQEAFSSLAKRFNAYLVAGTTPIINTPTNNNDFKYYAASLVYAPSGDCIARYNKIHLFDVDVADKTQAYCESNTTIAGSQLSRFDSPWGNIAQAVCYDLRFATMFQSLCPANVVVIPSAFTKLTGNAHWHALLQARAIEMQSYVVAANQVGRHQDGRETFGHSCVYSPWGEQLSIIKNDEGAACAVFDASILDDIRQRMPVQAHQQERYTFE